MRRTAVIASLGVPVVAIRAVVRAGVSVEGLGKSSFLERIASRSLSRLDCADNG